MTMHSSVLPDSEPQSVRARISVLAVSDDRSVLESLETGLDDENRVAVRTATTVAAALERLADVDCLVLTATTLDADSAAVTPDPDADTNVDVGVDADAHADSDGATSPSASTADVLDRIRHHAPDLPIVVLPATDEFGSGADSRSRSRSGSGSRPGSEPEPEPESESETASPLEHDPAVVDTVYSHRWTDYVPVTVHRETDQNFERLAHRIRALVERRRLTALSRRSLASIELAQDPIAIVRPDDTLEFANRWFAMQFGYDRAELPGHPWQAFFPDETVAHLESTAIPTVADGWRWTGRCTARRQSGETFPADIRLGGLEDGSLVVVVDEFEGGDGDGADE